MEIMWPSYIAVYYNPQYLAVPALWFTPMECTGLWVGAGCSQHFLIVVRQNSPNTRQALKVTALLCVDAGVPPCVL